MKYVFIALKFSKKFSYDVFDLELYAKFQSTIKTLEPRFSNFEILSEAGSSGVLKGPIHTSAGDTGIMDLRYPTVIQFCTSTKR